MDRLKWFYHPVAIFIFSIVALAASLFLYIYWYIGVSKGLAAVIEKYHIDPGQIFEIRTWVVIMVLSLLVGIILVGIFFIFVYYQKTWQLYRLQKNFISNFTHELKTPVTSLKLYLDTFARYNLSRDDQIKYIGFMIQDVNRLLENINRILSLARIESSSYWKEFEDADLVDAVQQFYKRNADLFPNCDIRIHNPVGKPLFYPINPPLFDMFLMNIMTNAVKYNKSATPRVDVRFIARRKSLDIQFEDNGIGIERAEIKKIFRIFYQIGHTDNMTAKGGGLGLYMASQIAKIHKGKVTAESEGIGKGTVFTLTLPLRVPVEG
ncbi:MAG: HAMP domain-containing histidine kinase [Deltaproteobacteria bacterium]|nr:HAMP domain-containing histidine kinase [Deltaproteobacteria bacterium]